MGKFIDFIITQNCTYKCSYCSQSKSVGTNNLTANKKTISNFLKFLDNIDEDFEITITGGEAILHEQFYDLIRAVKSKGFKINLITNLSFSFEIYAAIFNILGDSLNRFDVSCHVEQIKNFKDFLTKYDKFITYLPKNTSTTLFIPIYELDKDKKEKIDYLTNYASKNNIQYEFQQIRILNKYSKISKFEEEYLSEENIIKSFSKYCLSGCNSCVIYENGDVYRCYSSRFTKSNYLGNINNKKFKLNSKEKVCSFSNCTCLKPVKYNQILENSNYKNACLTKLYDCIFLPFLLIKNRNIVITKIKHYLKLKNN